MESKFIGSVWGFIGWTLLFLFILPMTLYLALPWWVAGFYRWLIKNSFIDGKQLRFEGTGSGLFGSFILWWLLCIVTLGIYGFWVPKKMVQWVVTNTHFAE